jgi:RNA polymerase sigma factor (sigma-70 family)
MDDSLKAWFHREILVHETSLVRYLTRVWPRRDEVHDLRQDIYIKVYEAAMVSRPQSTRAFLFATARHLLADRVRRRRIVSIDAVGDLDELNVMINEISPERIVRSGQDLRQLAVAFDDLPSKCREVVWLRRVDDFTQKETAMQLGVSPKTVENHLSRGMRFLADAMFGVKRGEKVNLNQDSDQESGHGQQTD